MIIDEKVVTKLLNIHAKPINYLQTIHFPNEESNSYLRPLSMSTSFIQTHVFINQKSNKSMLLFYNSGWRSWQDNLQQRIFELPPFHK